MAFHITLGNSLISACVLTSAARMREDVVVLVVCAISQKLITVWKFMTKKHHCKHPSRGISTYSRNGKGVSADKYGEFSTGVQITPDRIAGKTIWSLPSKEDKKLSLRKQIRKTIGGGNASSIDNPWRTPIR